MERIIYYDDLNNDDFAGTEISTVCVDEDFPYLHSSFLWKVIEFLVYYLIAVPIVFLTTKVYLGLRFENRKVLKKLGKSGYYLYGNHTRALDAFVPSMAAFPKKAYIIANPDAVSLPFLKNIVQMLGAVPVPTEAGGMKNFVKAIYTHYREKACIAIYPEAHIWPFYTGIRPFGDTSFRYPVREHAPVVAMVTTYRKRKGLFRFCRRPGMTITFSEPMYADPALSNKAAQRDLRDRTYAFMKETAARKENIVYIRYLPRKERTEE